MIKTQNFGFCALCRKEGILMDSHLTPKWIYRRLRSASNDKDDPVNVEKGSAFMTSKQIKKALLCGECEGRFSVREDYVARLTDDIATNLTQYISLIGADMPNCVELNRDKIDTERLSYFATSMIWRSCFMEGGCKLGKYEDQFRTYLLEETDFPSLAALTISIIGPATAGNAHLYNLYTAPTSGRSDLLWFHGFSLFGLTFRCFVGQALEPDWKEQICLAGPSRTKYALFLSFNNCADHQVAIRSIMGAKARGKLLTRKAKR
jgi:hypothetical protein